MKSRYALRKTEEMRRDSVSVFIPESHVKNGVIRQSGLCTFQSLIAMNKT